jgi:hypothetical protein
MPATPGKAKISIETEFRTGRHHPVDAPCETANHWTDADGLRKAVDAPLLDKTRDPYSLPSLAAGRVEEGLFYASLISGEK